MGAGDHHSESYFINVCCRKERLVVSTGDKDVMMKNRGGAATDLLQQQVCENWNNTKEIGTASVQEQRARV